MKWIYLRERVAEKIFVNILVIIFAILNLCGSVFLAFKTTMFCGAIVGNIPIFGFALIIMMFFGLIVVFWFVIHYSLIFLLEMFPTSDANKPFYDFLETTYQNNKVSNFNDISSLKKINKAYVRMFNFNEINKKDASQISDNNNIFSIEINYSADKVMGRAFSIFINEIINLKDENLSVFVCQKYFQKDDIKDIGLEQNFIPTENIGYSYKTNGIDTVIYFLSKWEVPKQEPIYYCYALNMKSMGEKMIEWGILYSYCFRGNFRKLRNGEIDFKHPVLVLSDSSVDTTIGTYEHHLDRRYHPDRRSYLPLMESIAEQSLNKTVFEMKNTFGKSKSSEEATRSFVVDLG